MERHEWKATLPTTSTVSKKLLDYIDIALERCEKRELRFFASYEMSFKASQYTWYDVSETDKKRVSAIPFKYYESKCWEWKKEESEIDRLNENFRELINYKPLSDTRAQHGVYLKLGKVISFIFPSMEEKDVSCLCSALSDVLREKGEPSTTSVKISDTPSVVYCMQHDCSGSVGSSCMRSERSERFKLYDDLGLKIAYIESDGGILLGRALLHASHKMMDRIYSNNSNTEAIFKQYAKEIGYCVKEHQALGVHSYIAPNGRKLNGIKWFIHCHDLQDEGYSEVPYVDTFTHYDKLNNRLYAGYNHNCCTSLHNTNGTDENGYIVEDNSYRCISCGTRVNEDDCYYAFDEIYCENCYREGFTSCDHCGETVNRDDIQYITDDDIYVCIDCNNRNYYTCDRCNSVNREPTTEVNNYGDVCRECLDNFNYCEVCDQYYSGEECCEEEGEE